MHDADICGDAGTTKREKETNGDDEERTYGGPVAYEELIVPKRAFFAFLGSAMYLTDFFFFFETIVMWSIRDGDDNDRRDRTISK
jgi:hypothetical protein